MSFDPDKEYTDFVTITDTLDTYLMAKELMNVLTEEIEKVIPAGYRHRVRLTFGKVHFDRQKITWTYK
jgi:hypothetical protein